MKTIKLVLPLFAFLFAIASSLATVNAKVSLTDVRVSKMTTPATCSNIGKCTVQSGDICTHPDSSQLKEYFPGSGTCVLVVFEGTWAGN